MGGGNGLIGSAWYNLVLIHSSADATTTCFFVKACLLAFASFMKHYWNC
jgi:hypothetical protein